MFTGESAGKDGLPWEILLSLQDYNEIDSVFLCNFTDHVLMTRFIHARTQVYHLLHLFYCFYTPLGLRCSTQTPNTRPEQPQQKNSHTLEQNTDYHTHIQTQIQYLDTAY